MATDGSLQQASSVADLEFAISALEAQWRADGIIMKATALRTFAVNEIAPMFSVSMDDISKSSTVEA